MAQVTRFAATTVSHRPNPSPIEREALKRREAPPATHHRHQAIVAAAPATSTPARPQERHGKEQQEQGIFLYRKLFNHSIYS